MKMCVFFLPNHKFALQNDVQFSQVATTRAIPTECCFFASAVARTIFSKSAEKRSINQT